MFIHLNQISKSFGSKMVLQDISFQVNAGDKIGLVGRNGSGKTTLFRLMQGNWWEAADPWGPALGLCAPIF